MRAAQSAAEVEHVRVGSEAECLDDFQRCRTATDMELVERSEVGRSHSCTVQTGRVQGGTDGRHKPPGAAVEPRNLVHRAIVAPSCRDVDEKIESFQADSWRAGAHIGR